ncbi:MAG: nitroreductase [Anaerolineae bacterium]|nr:nitroreductase [Anaerolineae bacterium]
MLYSKPVAELIQQRFSCRSYLNQPIAQEKRELLTNFIALSQVGPFGAPVRFALATATEHDRKALKSLGTYGFIKGATGFVIGAVGEANQNLEDFGYLMERIIIFATDIGLGTCWLGGTFTKSRFAQKIELMNGESVPAVTSIGYIAPKPRLFDSFVRRRAKAESRRPAETMFFEKTFGTPITPEVAGAYAVPLEMVRLGPSASNRQPWRIVKDGHCWHFYLQRSPGYAKRNRWLLNVADIQRLDMGIAMCHFELAANELGLPGKWEIREPNLEKPDDLTEYTVSWLEQ